MTDTITDAPASTVVVELYLDDVRPDPANLRHELDMDVVDGIAETIPELGILEPLIVRPAGDGTYVIVAGHNRHKAAELAGLDTVPCIVRDIDPSDPIAATLLMLVENLQRADLTPVEEAEGYRRLADAGWEQKHISAAVGRSQPVVSKRLALTALPAEALAALQDKRITVRQAEDLTKVDVDTVLEIVGAKGGVDDWKIRNAVIGAENTAKVAEAEKAISDRGVKQITHQDRWADDAPRYVEAALDEEPVAAIIDGAGRITWLVTEIESDDDDEDVEVDPARAAREAEWNARNAERERLTQMWTDAAGRHEAVIRQALTASTTPKEAITYADRAIVAMTICEDDYPEAAAADICDFLELKYEVNESFDYVNPDGAAELFDLAGLSPRGATRVLLATVAVNVLKKVTALNHRGDGHDLTRSVAIHYDFLRATGYVVPADEQAELDRITATPEPEPIVAGNQAEDDET